jgi:hypothetical protein
MLIDSWWSLFDSRAQFGFGGPHFFHPPGSARFREWANDFSRSLTTFACR